VYKDRKGCIFLHAHHDTRSNLKTFEIKLLKNVSLSIMETVSLKQSCLLAVKILGYGWRDSWSALRILIMTPPPATASQDQTQTQRS